MEATQPPPKLRPAVKVALSSLRGGSFRRNVPGAASLEGGARAVGCSWGRPQPPHPPPSVRVPLSSRGSRSEVRISRSGNVPPLAPLPPTNRGSAGGGGRPQRAPTAPGRENGRAAAILAGSGPGGPLGVRPSVPSRRGRSLPARRPAPSPLAHTKAPPRPPPSARRSERPPPPEPPSAARPLRRGHSAAAARRGTAGGNAGRSGSRYGEGRDKRRAPPLLTPLRLPPRRRHTEAGAAPGCAVLYACGARTARFGHARSALGAAPGLPRRLRRIPSAPSRPLLTARGGGGRQPEGRPGGVLGSSGRRGRAQRVPSRPRPRRPPPPSRVLPPVSP